MNAANLDEAFQGEFTHLDRKFTAMKGYLYIKVTWENKEKAVSATELYCSSQPEDPDRITPLNEKWFYPEMGIAVCKTPDLPLSLTDSRTIAQIKDRVEVLLINLESARQNGDEPLITCCTEELEMLWNYLSTCVTKNGHIRYLDICNRKHQLLVYRAVQKFCAKLQESHPDLTAYIWQHIVIRMRCYWREVGIRRKG